MEDIIVGKFKMTGGNTINIDLVTKRWNHLWWLSEWKRDNSWRLIKYVRKDSPMTACKLTISPEQAQELINKLNLVSENVGFASGFSWRREEDMKHLVEYRAKKEEKARLQIKLNNGDNKVIKFINK